MSRSDAMRFACRRDVDGSGAPVTDRHSGRLDNAIDKLAVQVEAADGEIEKRGIAIFGFREWREHARRRLRRAHAGLAIIDELHRGAAARQFICDARSDDSSPDDDDVGRTRQTAEFTFVCDGASSGVAAVTEPGHLDSS